MAIPDPVALIVALLKADTAVEALVAGRVYGGGVPAKNAQMQAAVAVVPAGGRGRRGVQGWRNTRIDTVCYGATLHESWTVHLAVREALETAKPSGALKSVETSSDGSNALDPVTQFPTCYASYIVLSTVTV